MSDALSSLFGKKPRPPAAVQMPAKEISKEPANLARDELLKRLAKLRRATQTSELSSPNVKRKTLGAGV